MDANGESDHHLGPARKEPMKKDTRLAIDGVVFTSHRRVTPRRADGAPARLPLLVDVRLEEFRLRADPRPQRSSPGS